MMVSFRIYDKICLDTGEVGTTLLVFCITTPHVFCRAGPCAGPCAGPGAEDWNKSMTFYGLFTLFTLFVMYFVYLLIYVMYAI